MSCHLNLQQAYLFLRPHIVLHMSDTACKGIVVVDLNEIGSCSTHLLIKLSQLSFLIA